MKTPRALILAALLASGSVHARPIVQDQPVTIPTEAPSTGVTAPVQDAPSVQQSSESGATGRTPGDRYEKFNRSMFGIQQKFDRAIFRPVARGYATIIPKFVRSGLRNLLRHIREPIVFLHDVLQLKPKRAVRTLGRFAINTTAGIGGLFDVAKTAKLPHRNNGLGNTLARYGVEGGPYLFLPLVGPTQLRDLFGGGADGLIYPIAIGSPFNRTDYQVSTAAIGGLDLRAESDAGFKALLDGAADPYASLRSVYLQNRAVEIAEIKGEATTPGGLDDPLIDPEADAAAPADEPARRAPEDSEDSLAPPPEQDPAPTPSTMFQTDDREADVSALAVVSFF